ncbi:hypothetical protein [Desulfocurvus sp. DL9XJH121]
MSRDKCGTCYARERKGQIVLVDGVWTWDKGRVADYWLELGLPVAAHLLRDDGAGDEGRAVGLGSEAAEEMLDAAESPGPRYPAAALLDSGVLTLDERAALAGEERAGEAEAGEPEGLLFLAGFCLERFDPRPPPRVEAIVRETGRVGKKRLALRLTVGAMQAFGVEKRRNVVLFYSAADRVLGMRFEREKTPWSMSVTVEKQGLGLVSCHTFLTAKGLEPGTVFPLRLVKDGGVEAVLGQASVDDVEEAA